MDEVGVTGGPRDDLCGEANRGREIPTVRVTRSGEGKRTMVMVVRQMMEMEMGRW